MQHLRKKWIVMEKSKKKESSLMETNSGVGGSQQGLFIQILGVPVRKGAPFLLKWGQHLSQESSDLLQRRRVVRAIFLHLPFLSV